MKEFFKKNKWQLLIVFVFGLLAYSVKLGTYSVSIDTEALINDPVSQIGAWISIGRWGLGMIKNLLHLIPINIFLTNIFAFIIFYISIIIWFINLDKMQKNKNNKLAKLFFGLIVITAPIFAEQFYFSLQSVEIALAFLGLAIALYFQEKWVESNKIWAIFPTILLVTYSFGCYQAFIPLYIAICVFDYICRYDGKVNVKRILKYLLIFSISFILNTIIDKIFKYVNGIPDTNYLSSQIVWGTERKKITIDRVRQSIWDSFIGIGLHETISYGIIFILMTLVLNSSKSFKENKFFYLAYLFLFMIAPFMTTIIKGTPETARAKFAIPFVTGFAFYYVLSNTDKKEILNMTKFVAIYTVIIQTLITFDLFYSDYNRYKEDVEVAKKVEQDLKECDLSKPIIFIGKYQSKNVHLKGEILGTSFFAHDAESIIGCSYRALGFMNTLGMKDYNLISSELAVEAREELSEKIANQEIDLKLYPDNGYVIELEDYIIVNF